MRVKLFTILTVLVSLVGISQNKDVLLKIENDPVYASDFKRIYLKNLELVKDEKQKDVDEYLKLFTNYKLKLKEAEALGLDEKPVFKREFDNYRSQLLKNYIYDTKVTEGLVKEAYERLKQEIDGTHILVLINPEASPEDTLKAYKKISEIRERAIKEGFEKVQKEVSDRRTVIGEDLGYFTAFKMVYDFETKAYNTKVGDVTEPFRTRFGYHILKVKDKRPGLGKVTVAHIMLNTNVTDVEDPKKRIDEIHQRIKQGEDFSALAKQFSEDKSSSSRGGLLDEFSSGQLSSEIFEEEAFKLKNINDISAPFKTKFGWHILKLHGKKDLESYEYLKPELERKIRRDSRSKVIDKSRLDNLLKKYDLSFKNEALPYFASSIDAKQFAEGQWKLPENFDAKKPFVKIGNKQFTYKDFGDELLRSQRGPKTYNSNNELVDEVYKRFLTDELYKYQEDNLENDNKEFAQLVQEFRDGLLIFDVMESQVWEASKKDTVALKDYYAKHKANYFSKESLEANVISSANKKDIKKALKMLKKGTSIEDIKKQINTEDNVSLTFANGTFSKDDQALPKKLKFKKGLSKIYKHNKAFVLVDSKNVLPKAQLDFKDAKGRVISDYQTDLESKWLKQLKEKFNVSLNQATLDKVKAELKS